MACFEVFSPAVSPPRCLAVIVCPWQECWWGNCICCLYRTLQVLPMCVVFKGRSAGSRQTLVAPPVTRSLPYTAALELLWCNGLHCSPGWTSNHKSSCLCSWNGDVEYPWFLQNCAKFKNCLNLVSLVCKVCTWYSDLITCGGMWTFQRHSSTSSNCSNTGLF